MVTLTVKGRNQFDEAVEAATGEELRAATIDTIQVNIGLTCNLACHHCHVESGPKRKEQMDTETMLLVLRAAARANARTIDITGGAPEMNPDFRWFVSLARERGFKVIVRTNLTVMLKDGYTDMPEFFKDHRVHLVASLPCYLPDNVNRQRGLHVYEESVEVIRRLNALGYGRQDDLPLDLVFNPLGASLPPPQQKLEAEYKRELLARWGLRFTKLYTITNMPIGRFQRDLERSGQAEPYWEKLTEAFNAGTVPNLMCRYQVHVSYDGTLHDCDFNYALGMPTGHGTPRHIRDFDAKALRHRRIVTDRHCLGCTAGCGSSCGGALT